MVNVKDKKCIVCKKIQSNFGLSETSKTHCAKHKFPGMLKNQQHRTAVL